MKLDAQIFPRGMTVRELKDYINRWPDVDEMGDPLCVWIGDGKKSNIVNGAWPLSKREVKGTQYADILLIAEED